jgi:hypothetical protein
MCERVLTIETRDDCARRRYRRDIRHAAPNARRIIAAVLTASVAFAGESFLVRTENFCAHFISFSIVEASRVGVPLLASLSQLVSACRHDNEHVRTIRIARSALANIELENQPEACLVRSANRAARPNGSRHLSTGILQHANILRGQSWLARVKRIELDNQPNSVIRGPNVRGQFVFVNEHVVAALIRRAETEPLRVNPL